MREKIIREINKTPKCYTIKQALGLFEVDSLLEKVKSGHAIQTYMLNQRINREHR
jgi:hypothetical protein